MNIEDIKNILNNDLVQQLDILGSKPCVKSKNKKLFKIIKTFNFGLSNSEFIYLRRHESELNNLHIFCNICGNKNTLKSLKDGYHIHCSAKCSANDEFTKLQIENSKLTNIDNNGKNSIQRGVEKCHQKRLNDIDENNLNSYQRASRKAAITGKSNIDEDGKNSYQRAEEKRKMRKREKYNDENWNNREQAKKTTKERTGFEYTSQIENWKNIMKSKKDEINRKRGDKNELKFGNRVYARSAHRFYLDPNHKHFEDINEEFFRNNFILDGKFNIEMCANYFGTKNCWVYKFKKTFNIVEPNITLLKDKNVKSKPQQQLYDFIKSIYNNKILYNTKSIISPQELDIYLPNVNLAIEFNGMYWHSIKANKHKYYHQNKFKACLAKGIRLIQIYEDEWSDSRKQEIIKNIIKRAIGLDNKAATNLFIDEISEEQYKEFCNNYNLDGYKEANIKLGLFDNNKLIQILGINLKENFYNIFVNCYNFDLYKDYTKELLEYFCVNFNKRKLHIFKSLNCDKDEIQIYFNCNFKIISLLNPIIRHYENLSVFDSGRFALIS